MITGNLSIVLPERSLNIGFIGNQLRWNKSNVNVTVHREVPAYAEMFGNKADETARGD